MKTEPSPLQPCDYIVDSDAGTITINASLIGDFNSGNSSIVSVTGGSGDICFAFEDGAVLGGAIDGGSGSNSLDYSAFSTGVTVDLESNTATAVTGGIANIGQVTGGRGDDSLYGTSGDDALYGGAGRDTLVSRGGQRYPVRRH